MAVVSRRSHFELDLGRETLQASSAFHVLLAAGDGTMAGVGGAGGGGGGVVVSGCVLFCF